MSVFTVLTPAKLPLTGMIGQEGIYSQRKSGFSKIDPDTSGYLEHRGYIEKLLNPTKPMTVLTEQS